VNIFATLNQNPVVLYGLIGSVAGAMMGGSKKARTQAAFTFGAVGAAAGFFMDKSNAKRQQAQVKKQIAVEAAADAVEAAGDAKEAAMAGFGAYGSPANRPPKGSPAYHRARRMMKKRAAANTPAPGVGMMAVPGVF